MTFQQAVQSGLQNYANFKDRSCRSEYWWWFLFAIIVGVVGAVIDAIIGIQIVSFIAGLALLLPGLAVGVRRLHDIGKSGWFILLGIIPIINFIGVFVLIYFFVQPTQPVPNEWGTGPLPPPA